MRLLEKFDGDIAIRLNNRRTQRPRTTDLAGFLQYTASLKEGA